MKRIYTSIALAALALTANAATIEIDFLAADQFAAPGTTIVYSANLRNLTNADLDLGAALVSIGGNLVADAGPFLNGPAVLPADASTGVFDIFTVTLPFDTPLGSVFPGVLSITDTSDNVLGTSSFTVHAVPEPPAYPLIAIGLAALAAGGAFRRRRHPVLHRDAHAGDRNAHGCDGTGAISG